MATFRSWFAQFGHVLNRFNAICYFGPLFGGSTGGFGSRLPALCPLTHRSFLTLVLVVDAHSPGFVQCCDVLGVTRVGPSVLSILPLYSVGLLSILPGRQRYVS